MSALLCRLGLHRWRTVFRRNRRMDYGRVVLIWESKRYGEFTPYAKRCQRCGKSQQVERLEKGKEWSFGWKRRAP